ncbi:MAG TPA: rhodanese-like domain-containing protein [Thermomicrobiales bacterium]|nr:rhodanese-like domain-containing protein [Thermomicrobiales bacterium]
MARKTARELVAEAKSRIENLDNEQLEAEIAAGAVVVDIREANEREQSGAIPGAIHVPRGLLEFVADPESPMHRDEFDFDRRIVLHCATGGRSALAAAALQDMGFTNVAHLEPGFNGWAAEGKPVEEVEPVWRPD